MWNENENCWDKALETIPGERHGKGLGNQKPFAKGEQDKNYNAGLGMEGYEEEYSENKAQDKT